MRITAQHQTSTWFEYTHHKQYLATDYFMLISFHIQYMNWEEMKTGQKNIYKAFIEVHSFFCY